MSAHAPLACARAVHPDLAAMVDAAPLLIASIDAALRYRQVNAEYERWWQRPPAWFIGKNVADTVAPAVYAQIEPQLRRALAGEMVAFEYTEHVPDGVTGAHRQVRARYQPHLTAGGQDGLIVVIEDLSAQRAATHALHNTREQLQSIVDNLPALVAYIDADCRYRYVNAGYLAWYQKPAHAFVGHRVEELVGDSFSVTGPLMQRALAGESLDFEYERCNPLFDDPHRILRVRLLPDLNAGGVRGFITLIEDITERRRAEATLLRAQQDIRGVIDTIPALIAAFDMEARFVYANQQTSDWFGATSDELIGRPLFERMPVTNVPLLAPAVARVLAGEHLTDAIELPAVRPADGALRHYRIEYAPLRDENRQRGFVAVAQDISAMVAAQTTLREQALLLHQITEHSSEAFCLTDLARTTLIFGSSAHERIFGIANAALIASGRTWLDFVHADDRPTVAARFAQTTAMGGFDAEYRLVQPSGTVRWVHDHADIVCNPDGHSIRLATVIRDITERVLQQQLIERNAERLAQAQRAAHLGLWELDFASGDLYWSPELRRMFELDDAAATPNGATYTRFLHPDDAAMVSRQVALAEAGGNGYDIEHRVVLASGRVLHIHSQATVERSADGRACRMTGLVRDISQRRAAELAQHRSDMRLRQITETIDDAFWLISLDDSTPFYISPGFETIYGRPCAVAQATVAGWLEAVHADDRARMAEQFTAMRAGQPLDLEYRILRPDGSVRWVHEKTHAVCDETGRMTAIAGVTSDVSARHQQHAALVEFAQRLERAQAVGNLGFWELDISDATFWCSKQLRQILALAPAASVRSYDEFLARVHADDRAYVRHQINIAIGSAPGFDIDHRIVRADGEIRHLRNQGTIERAVDGRPLQLVGIAQDITARKQIELEAQESALRLRQITENIDHVFWLYEASSGAAVYVSPSYTKVWDLPMSAAYSDPLAWLAQVHPEDRADVERAFRDCLQRGHADIEFRAYSASAEPRWMHARAFPIADEHGQIYRIAGITADITYRKRIAELQRLKDDAENANRSKSAFLSKMSHELRTPLNAILGFSQLLTYDKQRPLDPDQRENVEEISNAGRHLLEIVDEMLDVTRIEMGKLRVTITPIDVGEVVAECLAMAHSDAARRRMTIVSTLRAGERVLALGDRTRARQIVLNLLGNAVKYIPEQGRIVVALDEHSMPGCVRITVTDNGPGLSAEQISKLFVPFQRLDAERISSEGLGLGLALSKQLAEAMGGALGARCTLGAGCTFWLDLPAATADHCGAELAPQ